MDTKIPEITDEDHRNYEWFVNKVAETSFENNLPVEWFAQVEKLRTFGLPTVDFPPRDKVATFKAIVENIDKEYKAGNPLPLRMFVEDTKGMMTSSLIDGPFATGSHMDAGSRGIYIREGRRVKFYPIAESMYKSMMLEAYADLKDAGKEFVVVFGRDDDGYTHEVIPMPANLPSEATHATTGAYTRKALKKIVAEINEHHSAYEAMGVGKQLMAYRAPASQRRSMENDWARRGRQMAEVGIGRENWGEEWTQRYQTSGLFDSVKNVISGGVGKVGETRDSVIDRLNRGIRDFNFSLKTGADYGGNDTSDSEDDMPSAADALCLLVSQHTGVPCERDAPWRDDLFGPAKMNYQKMLATLQLFLWRHGFDERSGDHRVLRTLIHGDHKCESIPLGASKGTQFTGPEMEEIGAEWVPVKDMKDGEMSFAKNVPIRFSMMVRNGRDGAWVSYLFPLTTSSDGTSVFLSHDETGEVTGLMVTKPSARGRAWTRIWQPRV